MEIRRSILAGDPRNRADYGALKVTIHTIVQGQRAFDVSGNFVRQPATTNLGSAGGGFDKCAVICHSVKRGVGGAHKLVDDGRRLPPFLLLAHLMSSSLCSVSVASRVRWVLSRPLVPVTMTSSGRVRVHVD